VQYYRCGLTQLNVVSSKPALVVAGSVAAIDVIDPKLCLMSYVSVDEVANLVTQKGNGTLLAKVDIESAYRLVAVHQRNHPLLAMQWKGKLFINPM